MNDMSELGPIFPACPRCGRALYLVPDGGGNSAHFEQDTAAIDCEQRGADELVATLFPVASESH